MGVEYNSNNALITQHDPGTNMNQTLWTFLTMTTCALSIDHSHSQGGGGGGGWEDTTLVEEELYGDSRWTNPMAARNPRRLTTMRMLHVCLARKKVGPCRGSFRRFYYDFTRKKCKTFVYGGCKSNGNNFRSKKKCQTICHREAKHLAQLAPANVTCTLQKSMGPCKYNVQRYYYDINKRRCKPFTYGGCEGNGNNFQSLSQCKQHCDRGSSGGGQTSSYTRRTAAPRYYSNRNKKKNKQS